MLKKKKKLNFIKKIIKNYSNILKTKNLIIYLKNSPPRYKVDLAL